VRSNAGSTVAVRTSKPGDPHRRGWAGALSPSHRGHGGQHVAEERVCRAQPGPASAYRASSLRWPVPAHHCRVAASEEPGDKSSPSLVFQRPTVLHRPRRL